MVRQLHEKVRLNIERKTKQYETQANKGHKHITFEPGDWVWIYLRKDRFLMQMKSKLQPRGDGPFQVVARVNDNAYKLDLPGEYNVSATFNVTDLSPFLFDDVGADLRTNHFEENGNDGSHIVVAQINKGIDALQNLGGPMTRARSKKIKEALNNLLCDIYHQEVARYKLRIMEASSGLANVSFMEEFENHSLGKDVGFGNSCLGI